RRGRLHAGGADGLAGDSDGGAGEDRIEREVARGGGDAAGDLSGSVRTEGYRGVESGRDRGGAGDQCDAGKGEAAPGTDNAAKDAGALFEERRVLRRSLRSSGQASQADARRIF